MENVLPGCILLFTYSPHLRCSSCDHLWSSASPLPQSGFFPHFLCRICFKCSQMQLSKELSVVPPKHLHFQHFQSVLCTLAERTHHHQDQLETSAAIVHICRCLNPLIKNSCMLTCSHVSSQ